MLSFGDQDGINPFSIFIYTENWVLVYEQIGLQATLKLRFHIYAACECYKNWKSMQTYCDASICPKANANASANMDAYMSSGSIDP